jgi:Flp pilus assembly protein TadD
VNTALENRRDDVTLLDTKGLILMNDGRASEAIPVLQRAVELSCQHPIYCLHLAKAYDIVGQVSPARNWFEKSRPKLESIPRKLTPENKNMFDDLRMKYPPDTNTTPNL